MDGKLTNTTELLYRQVHPRFVDEGRVSSQAFTPSEKDNGRLSVSQSTKTTPESAYHFFTETRKLQSVGVWAVSVEEADSLELPVFSDPLPDDPSHAVIDFNKHSTTAKRKLGSRLAEFARNRGVQFSP